MTSTLIFQALTNADIETMFGQENTIQDVTGKSTLSPEVIKQLDEVLDAWDAAHKQQTWRDRPSML